MIDITKQGQAVYCGLYNAETKKYNNWEEKTMMSVIVYHPWPEKNEKIYMSYKQTKETKAKIMEIRRIKSSLDKK